MDATALVSKVKTEGGFDVDDATALGWINEVYSDAVGRSGWIERVVSLGLTVAGTSKYVIADDYVEIRSVKVGGARYTLSVSVEEMWDLQSGAATFHQGRSADGAFSEAFDDSAVRYVELWPTPGTAGSAIAALVTKLPTDLVLTPTPTSPVIPLDLHSMLVSGGLAVGLERWSERPDLATPHWAKFQGPDGTGGKVEELRRRANARVGGSRAQRVAVYGYDFA